MYDLGRHKKYAAKRKSHVNVVTGQVEPHPAQILSALQQVEGYWDTVFDEMPPILRSAIANNAQLRRSLQTNLQAATNYAALVRRQVQEGNLKEATKTVVRFQETTRSFHQSAQRWNVVELGRWLASEAVKDAYAGVVAVGEWISELPDAIRNIGKGAVNLGKWLIGGAVALAVILAVRK